MSATTYPFKENAYTLYSYPLCPFAQRAVRAFNIAKVPYVIEEIDLKNKPDWYHLVNPQLKVPALRTPDGTILIESLVISEFVADQFPEAGLLPTDATERAQLRLFIELFGTRVTPFIYKTLTSAEVEDQKKAAETLLEGIKAVSDELEKQWARSSGKGGPYWYGEKFGYAEIITTSFVGLLVTLRHFRGVEVPETEEYAAFNKWKAAFSQHPGFTDVKPEDDVLIEAYKKYAAETKH
ncbi:hypothetical protein FBU31_002411 [Coemansia sp. 'formosensis']|uniref:Uncharacterized protein n=1 Tax=Coemansia furcata TaxID=417177 RepID=A0ACC1L6W1_9FUNG|nr:hypothetical protein H4S07_004790 [Coemansia furcata]KAJ2830883.1 hypothetical protein FBU31_002411 [Coemansia sp. 'formosensis']